MRTHRVWNDIYADNYTTSKSFGGEFTQRIAVGSSASYSNPFATIEVRETGMYGTDWSLFVLYLDGAQVKRAAFKNKTKEFRTVELGQLMEDVIEEAA